MAIDKNTNEYLEVLQELLRQEEEKHRNTMREVGGWILELVRNPIKLDAVTREYFLEHISKVYHAGIGDPLEDIRAAVEVEQPADNKEDNNG